jgi:DNA-3-methyladenine glycosylase II
MSGLSLLSPPDAGGSRPAGAESARHAGKRAESLIHLAQSVIDGTFPLSPPEDIEAGMKALQQRPGIGRWTANYLALRGWQAKDVFLPDDYLIKQRAGMTPAQIRRYAERWQPWRSYALLHIWYTDGWAPSVDGEIAGVEQ